MQAEIDNVSIKTEDVMKLIGPIEVDENRIARFLRLTDNNVEETAKLLKEDIKWREEIIQTVLNPDDVDRFHKEAEILKNCDINGNGIILVRSRFHKRLKTKAERELFLKFTMQMIEKLAKGTKQFSVIIDLLDLSISNFDLKSLIMELTAFNAHYADLLSTCLILKPFWLFDYIFGMVRHLLSSNVVERIHLIHNETELENFIDRKILPSDVSFSQCKE
ncbi:hypothetical protein GJ496_007706 [Pomphorhynchus laevis]|nr:hypothetical protein GJ496_007706 [Pomphorhynchus laevis]